MKQAITRWGIIGCGNVTEVKSGPAYQKVAGFELVAVMRRDAARAEDYARRHQVPRFFTDAAALIVDPGVDCVYIATPPDSHKAYALQVAAAGKPCCIEKPMAPSYLDCLEIEQAFAAKKLPLFVAYYRRSLPRFLQVRDWLQSGMIGAVRQVHWQFAKPAAAPDLSGAYNWRTDANIATGGHFDDLASHGLDLFAFLFGRFRAVAGVSGNQQQLYSARDAVAACWQHESGVMGSGNWNFGCADRQDRVQVHGSEGSIEFSVFGDAPLRLLAGGRETVLMIEHPPNIQLYHVDNMRKALHGELDHPSTGASAAHTAWVMDRILGKL